MGPFVPTEVGEPSAVSRSAVARHLTRIWSAPVALRALPGLPLTLPRAQDPTAAPGSVRCCPAKPQSGGLQLPPLCSTQPWALTRAKPGLAHPYPYPHPQDQCWDLGLPWLSQMPCSLSGAVGPTLTAKPHPVSSGEEP